MKRIDDLRVYLERLIDIVAKDKAQYLMAQGKTLNGNYAECQLRKAQAYGNDTACATAIRVADGEVIHQFRPQPFKCSRGVLNNCRLSWGRDDVKILLIPDELFELLLHVSRLLVS